MKITHIDGFEYYQGKNEGDIYIKILKDTPIDVEVNVNYPVKINSLNELRDEYHSIGELYEFRKMYNAILFNEWAINESWGGRITPKYDVHKSWKHHDGEDCFGGGWFIVVAMLPTGQITNHYKAEDWELFNIPVAEKAKYEFDGHTPADALDRMNQFLKRK